MSLNIRKCTYDTCPDEDSDHPVCLDKKLNAEIPRKSHSQGTQSFQGTGQEFNYGKCLKICNTTPYFFRLIFAIFYAAIS